MSEDLQTTLIELINNTMQPVIENALHKGYELGWMEAREYFGVVGDPNNQEVRAREDGATYQVTKYKKNLDERRT